MAPKQPPKAMNRRKWAGAVAAAALASSALLYALADRTPGKHELQQRAEDYAALAEVPAPNLQSILPPSMQDRYVERLHEMEEAALDPALAAAIHRERHAIRGIIEDSTETHGYLERQGGSFRFVVELRSDSTALAAIDSVLAGNFSYSTPLYRFYAGLPQHMPNFRRADIAAALSHLEAAATFRKHPTADSALVRVAFGRADPRISLQLEDKAERYILDLRAQQRSSSANSLQDVVTETVTRPVIARFHTHPRAYAGAPGPRDRAASFLQGPDLVFVERNDTLYAYRIVRGAMDVLYKGKL